MKLWAKGQHRSCTNLRLVRDVGLVACGQCENCHKGRIKDWVGRCLLEAQDCDHAFFATLTVGSDRMFDPHLDPVRSVMFHREDVTAYLKRLREVAVKEWRKAKKTQAGRDGYRDRHELIAFPEKQPKLRLFWAGELTDRKARVHYHLIQYWTGCKGPSDLPIGRFCFHGKYPPEVVEHLNLQVIDRDNPRWDFRRGSGMDWHKSDRTYWPFGMVRYLEFDARHAFYVAGYIVLSNGTTDVMRPGVSRRPILGAEHLCRLAESYVDQMLAPNVKTYKLPRNEGYHGPLEEYWLPESGVRLLCREFVARWAIAHAVDPARYAAEWPKSELVDNYIFEEEERRYEKANAGKPTREDEMWLEAADQRKREAVALRKREPIRLADVGRGGVARIMDQLGEAVPEEINELISKTALKKMADASFSEGVRLRKRAVERYRKLKTGAKSRPKM